MLAQNLLSKIITTTYRPSLTFQCFSNKNNSTLFQSRRVFAQSLQGSYRVYRPEANTTPVASHIHTRDNKRHSSFFVFFHNKQKPRCLNFYVSQTSHPPHHYIAPSDEPFLSPASTPCPVLWWSKSVCKPETTANAQHTEH